MDLERVSVRLRPRTPWEAIDLGFALARATWRRLYGAWAAVYWPVALAAFGLLREHPVAATLLLWWLKPAFDRVALHVLGEAVFGDPPTVRQTLRALRSALAPGLLASLTLYRFDAARSFNLPVWQLERQRGGEARRRAALLHRRARGSAVWLTVVCANFELVVVLSLTGAVSLLIPQPYGADFDPLLLYLGAGGERSWLPALQFLFYVLAVSLIEPCYVAAGFALYLNRRTQLEAWDIELALRRLSEAKAKPAALSVAASVVLAAFCATLACLPAQPARAQATDATAAKQVIGEVLKQPEFDEYRQGSTWRYRGPGSWWEESEDKPSRPSTFWGALGYALAAAARVLGWIAVAALVVAAIIYASRHFGQFRQFRAAPWRPPDALFGMDLRPESLPDDIVAQALVLIAQERHAQALSLLYRGALSALVHRDGVELASGATEGDCLRAVGGSKPAPTAAYFARLVQAWSRAAYAARMPARADAEALAREWTAHFAEAPAA